jgi:hypothetical protein
MGYDPNCGYKTNWRKMEDILQEREEAIYTTSSAT